MDFTTATYRSLLTALQSAGYVSETVVDFFQAPRDKTIPLRHDVDLLPENSLRMARLEHEWGFVATYYFRAVPESWDEGIIREIALLGHEVGYHYENMDTVIRGQRSEDGKQERGRKVRGCMSWRMKIFVGIWSG